MTRRQRQGDELRKLCRSGSLARAVDLAFEHFADFGRNDDIVALLADAIEHRTAPESVHRRFADLRDSAPAGTDPRTQS